MTPAPPIIAARAALGLALCLTAGCSTASVMVSDPAATAVSDPTATAATTRLGPTYLQGVYPAATIGEEEEDNLTLADLRSYERTIGKTAGWVYFSHNWFHGRAFPTAHATWIRKAGSTPWIRLMLRSSSEQDVAEPTYNLKAILAGRFDADLRAWCDRAKAFGTPIIAEWGTEANGEWFSWNGVWNGGATTTGYGNPKVADGPERFVAVFRRIVGTCRARGVTNASWAWHINAESWPQETWNSIEAYWPGRAWVDLIAVSAYGAQYPAEDRHPSLRAGLDPVYPRLVALAGAGSSAKPLVLAEFGVTDHHPKVDQAAWARAALRDLVGGRWPRLSGFAWWNEHWQNDDVAAHDSNMRVQDNPKLAAVFAELVGRNPRILGRLPTGWPRPVP